MLVLTRKEGEMLRIGPEVTVKILEVRGGQVKLGFEAPRTVEIYREEIYRQIEEANLRALLPDRAALELAVAALGGGKGDKR